MCAQLCRGSLTAAAASLPTPRCHDAIAAIATLAIAPLATALPPAPSWPPPAWPCARRGGGLGRGRYPVAYNEEQVNDHGHKHRLSTNYIVSRKRVYSQSQAALHRHARAPLSPTPIRAQRGCSYPSSALLRIPPSGTEIEDKTAHGRFHPSPDDGACHTP